ncbi:hypothetical protein SPSIL_055280 [Sporomusa silvacetica DSM 10669]|uniref:2-dehydro-3-deoxygalactonokinase n=1 Tax=Sporomusa silvacetica DSM 10669 TaxID=1123289 RepID=A0ABZ3IU86_9FIRM|nr:2-dehydro-3-deoxygalactonokinase [Sporomusa silvacetica]OZC21170.1 putative 2-dehydro-3-deoxygalactonokinase DgoK1 [Sporomusa silvacetica DSM 10669]
MYVATIDTGTTNTRVKIWGKETLLGQGFCAVGVRDTAITGSKEKLTKAIKDTLLTATAAAGLVGDKLDLILASGMLTSNVGLLEVPHVAAPAGAAALAAGMVEQCIPSICRQPVWFIPGVKNMVNDLATERIDDMDIMRGEEVEVFGLLAKLKLTGPAVFILPGSHSKFVPVDGNGQITGCVTTMAGELLAVLSKDTILADAVGHGFSTRLEVPAFWQGVRCYQRLGLGRASFTVRILDQFTGYTLEEKRSYLLGIILADDMQAWENSHILQEVTTETIVVAGKTIFQHGMQALLAEKYPERNIMPVDTNVQADIAGLGAITIAKLRGFLP